MRVLWYLVPGGCVCGRSNFCALFTMHEVRVIIFHSSTATQRKSYVSMFMYKIFTRGSTRVSDAATIAKFHSVPRVFANKAVAGVRERVSVCGGSYTHTTHNLQPSKFKLCSVRTRTNINIIASTFELGSLNASRIPVARVVQTHRKMNKVNERNLQSRILAHTCEFCYVHTMELIYSRKLFFASHAHYGGSWKKKMSPTTSNSIAYLFYFIRA